MEFRFNLKKSHVIVIIVLLIVTGFGIAQTPPNPGHGSIQVDMGGGLNLNQWGSNIQNGINNHESAILILQSGRWTPITPSITADYLCWPNGAGVCSPGLTGGTYTGAVPVSAKEFLVYVAIYTGNSPPPGSGDPAYFEVYTQEGSTRYAHRILAAGPNSQTFWLPVTSDPQLYRNLVGGSMSNANTRVRIIGYR